MAWKNQTDTRTNNSTYSKKNTESIKYLKFSILFYLYGTQNWGLFVISNETEYLSIIVNKCIY